MSARIAMVCLVAICWFAPGAHALDQEGGEAARQALQRRANAPWYDAQTDSVRRIHVLPPDEASHRDSDWNAEDRDTPASTATASRGMSRVWAKLLQGLAWTLLAIVLTAVVLFLASAAMRMDAGARSSTQVLRQGDADRVEDLPFSLPRTEGDLLAAARRHYEAGNFSGAIVCLFSYQLVELDRYDLIRLARGKTNRQYLRELISHPDLRTIMIQTVIAFEAVFFGHHQLSRRRFEQCWQRLQDFHQLVRQETP